MLKCFEFKNSCTIVVYRSVRMYCTDLAIPYPRKHTLILRQIHRKRVITNAYPMKLLKATQARKKDRADKESESERQRGKERWMEKEKTR